MLITLVVLPRFFPEKVVLLPEKVVLLPEKVVLLLFFSRKSCITPITNPYENWICSIP